MNGAQRAVAFPKLNFRMKSLNVGIFAVLNTADLKKLFSHLVHPIWRIHPPGLHPKSAVLP